MQPTVPRAGTRTALRLQGLVPVLSQLLLPLVLLLLLPAPAAAVAGAGDPRTTAGRAAASSSPTSASSATCSFHITGDGNGAITSADMACVGGAKLSVIAEEALLGRFVPRWRRQGVTVSATDCQIRPCQCGIIITPGNHVTFVDSVVFNVSADYGTPSALPLALVCITSSTVTFQRSQWLSNGAIALRVRGGSSVTLEHCQIRDHVQGGPDIPSGAVSSADDNTITIRHSNLTGNNCTTGCGINISGGRLHVHNSSISGNNAFSNGGGMLLLRQTVATITHSHVAANSALTDGGGIAVDESTVALSHVHMAFNRANRSGGGLHTAYANSVVLHNVTSRHNIAQRGGGVFCEQTPLFVNASLFHNNRVETFGGGIMAHDNCSLTILDSRVEANKAGVYRVGTGGGIHANLGSKLRIQGHTVVANNSATRHGGGIRLISDNFVLSEVNAASKGRGNKAMYKGAEDVSLAPYNISVATSHARFIPGQGCKLHIAVKVLGPQGHESAGEDIEASMGGVKEQAVSDSTGVAHLYVRLYQHPGLYNFSIKARSDDRLTPEVMSAEVQPCPRGFIHQMQQSDWTCQMCGVGFFSFSTQDAECRRCPDNADSIGATLWPRPHHWHSSPTSSQIHRCLNADACKGGQQQPGPWHTVWEEAMRDDASRAAAAGGQCDLFLSSPSRRSVLEVEQRPAAAGSGYKDSQCSEGYSGHLCGVCVSPGYARVRTHTCRKCQPPATILALYVLAAIALLVVMKIVLNFHTSNDCQDLNGWTLMPQHSTGTPTSTSTRPGAGPRAGAGGSAAAGAAGAGVVQQRPPLVGHAIELAMIAEAQATAGGAVCSNNNSSSNGSVAGRTGPGSSGGGGASGAASSNGLGGGHAGSSGGGSSRAASSSGTAAGGGGLLSRMTSSAGASSSSGGGGASSSLLGVSTKEQLRDLSPTDIAKPFILYAQYLWIVASLNVPMPDTLSWPIKVIDWFWSSASSHVLSVECLMQGRHSPVPLAMRKVLIDLCMPLMLLAVLLCIEAIMAAWRRRRVRFGAQVLLLPAGQVVRVCIVVLFFFLPFLVRTVLGLFACIDLDEAADARHGEQRLAVGRWWLFDLNQQCYQGYHKGWAYGLGLPLALALCVALPAAIFAFTFSHRTRLGEARFRQQFSFLTRSFKQHYCWWEAVVVVETVILCLCATYASMLGPFYMGLLMIFAFAGMFVLLLCVQPHQYPLVTRVTLQGYGILWFTTYIIVTWLPWPGGPGAPRAYSMTLGVVVLLVNLAHIAYCVALLLRSVDWSKAKANTQAVVVKAKDTTLQAMSSVFTGLSTISISRSLSSLTNGSVARSTGSGARSTTRSTQPA